MPPVRDNLIRVPPALMKRIRRVALRAGLTYGEAVEQMIEGESARMDPYTALVNLREYLDSYGEDLADAIAQEAGKVRARCVERARSALDELEGEWPGELPDDEDEDEDEQEEEEQEQEQP